jgi:coenzyme F420 hydrogenase subunit beta
MAQQSIDRVIDGGFCIGCGACAALRPKDFSLDFTETGMFQARALSAPPDRDGDVSQLCPMSGEGRDETAIASALWPGLAGHEEIGRHALTAVGWVEEGDFRERGSSGGVLTWLAVELLQQGLVEEVVSIAPSAPGTEHLFRYGISRTAQEVRRAAKSRYYPIQARDVIDHIKHSGRPTLFVGLPCFVKMIRNLAEADPAIGQTVRYTLGLVCGHLKSAGFAEMLAWQVGVPPGRVGSVDFRVKVESQPASRYGFEAQETSPGAVVKQSLMEDLVGRNWGQGMLKYKACDYCDDVLAECADIAVGDAWLSPWTQDWRGTNVLVARHPRIVALLKDATAAGRLHLEPVTADQVADSQRGGLSHRREGLGWRLWKARNAGIWTPRKRVEPARALSRKRERIYDIRDRIRDDSHIALAAAKKEGRFEVFNERMAEALALYADATRRPGFLTRKISGLARRLRALLG